MKKQLIFVVAVLLVCVGLSGCFGQSDKNKFVGIWAGTISNGIAENVSVSITFLHSN